MSKTVEVGGRTYFVKCNNVPRLKSYWHDLPKNVRDDFIQTYGVDFVDRLESADFVQYRGSWYLLDDIETAPDDFKALGFGGADIDSAFSATVFRFFDSEGRYLDDEVIVGFIHW